MGWWIRKDYEAAKINCEKFKDIFVGLGKDAEEKGTIF